MPRWSFFLIPTPARSHFTVHYPFFFFEALWWQRYVEQTLKS